MPNPIRHAVPIHSSITTAPYDAAFLERAGALLPTSPAQRSQPPATPPRGFSVDSASAPASAPIRPTLSPLTAALTVGKGILHQGRDETVGRLQSHKNAAADTLNTIGYAMSQAITAGEAGRFADEPHAPAHLKQGKASFDAAVQGTRERLAALPSALTTFAPVNWIAAAAQDLKHHWLPHVRQRVDQLTHLGTHLSERWAHLKVQPTEENAFAVGTGIGAMAFAALGIVLPNGKRLPDRQVIDGRSWPIEGAQVEVYLDRDERIVYKRPKQRIEGENSTGTGLVVYELGPSQMDTWARQMTRFQNLVAQGENPRVAPPLSYLGAGWMSQPYVLKAAVSTMSPREHELDFQNTFMMIGRARQRLHAQSAKGPTSNYRLIDGWRVRLDSGSSNFIRPSDGPSAWIDRAYILPE